MSALDDAATALQQIQTDDADVQTQVTNALTAVQAAQANQGAPVVDPTWQAVQDALTANGWTAPLDPASDASTADATSSDTPVDASQPSE